MKFDVTDFLYSKNISKFSICEISDKVYIDFGNDLDVSDSVNTVIVYDDELNKTYIENAWINDNKAYILVEQTGATIIYEFDKKTRKRIFP